MSEQLEQEIRAAVEAAAKEAAQRQAPLDLSDLEARIQVMQRKPMPQGLEQLRDEWGKILAERDAANGKGNQS